jgi:hypothetical protein
MLGPDLYYRPAMSEHSIYLRDQAVKCRWHADNMTDVQTKGELRKLALEYDIKAGEIESNKVRSPPSELNSFQVGKA